MMLSQWLSVKVQRLLWLFFEQEDDPIYCLISWDGLSDSHELNPMSWLCYNSYHSVNEEAKVDPQPATNRHKVSLNQVFRLHFTSIDEIMIETGTIGSTGGGADITYWGFGKRKTRIVCKVPTGIDWLYWRCIDCVDWYQFIVAAGRGEEERNWAKVCTTLKIDDFGFILI